MEGRVSVLCDGEVHDKMNSCIHVTLGLTAHQTVQHQPPTLPQRTRPAVSTDVIVNPVNPLAYRLNREGKTWLISPSTLIEHLCL